MMSSLGEYRVVSGAHSFGIENDSAFTPFQSGDPLSIELGFAGSYWLFFDARASSLEEACIPAENELGHCPIDLEVVTPARGSIISDGPLLARVKPGEDDDWALKIHANIELFLDPSRNEQLEELDGQEASISITPREGQLFPPPP